MKRKRRSPRTHSARKRERWTTPQVIIIQDDSQHDSAWRKDIERTRQRQAKKQREATTPRQQAQQRQDGSAWPQDDSQDIELTQHNRIMTQRGKAQQQRQHAQQQRQRVQKQRQRVQKQRQQAQKQRQQAQKQRQQLPNPHAILRWTRNSCFIDSLLVIMFFSDGSDFYTTNVLNYQSHLHNQNYLRTYCEKRHAARIGSVSNYIADIQHELRHIKDGMLGKTPMVACKLRQLLGKCKSRISSGKFHSVTEVYNTLVELFPGLNIEYRKMTNKPHDGKQKIVDEIVDRKGDFIPSGDRPFIRHIDSDIVIFSNLSPFDTMYSPRAERLTFDGEIYTLFAVIYLKGAPPPSGIGPDDYIDILGAHYVSRIKMKDGKWYYYNDMGESQVQNSSVHLKCTCCKRTHYELNNATFLQEPLPKKFGEFKDDMWPELLFYKKVKS